MLTYLINVTDNLLAVSVVVGIAFAYLTAFYGKWGKRIAWMGLGAGVLASGIRAAITNTMRIKNAWKIGTYDRIITLVLLVLIVLATIVFSLKPVKKALGEKGEKIVGLIMPSVVALFLVACLFNTATDVYAYPFKMTTGDGGALSSEYLLRLGGYVLGLIVVVLTTVSTCKIGNVLAKKGWKNVVLCGFFAIVGVNGIYGFFRLMGTLITRNYIKSQTLFAVAASSTNNAMWYLFAEFFVVIAMGAFLWVKSFTQKEYYDTLAERRKQRSVWRTGKRYSVPVVLCLVVGILCATWFVELNIVKITEAPVEETIVLKNGMGEDETLVVPISRVSDGHMHRFGYKTSNGVTVRFIVVLKQEGTSNYGVGLDACEVCGEAGYYENNKGQVVCKKCGVIMNKTTIGMKGGCNPIIIDYDIDEQNITVPVREMIAHEKEFR